MGWCSWSDAEVCRGRGAETELVVGALCFEKAPDSVRKPIKCSMNCFRRRLVISHVGLLIMGARRRRLTLKNS